MADTILKSENTDAALREVTVLIQNVAGAGVSGVLLTGGTPATLKIGKAGGNFGASAGATLTEITGGVDTGVYALRFHLNDCDTTGELRYEITGGTPTIATCRGSVTIRPATRSVDVADGYLTNAKIADGFLTAAKLADGLLTAAKFGAAFVTAASFAANAIDANAMASSGGDDIGARVWAALHSANHAAGSMGDQLLALMMAAGINVVRDTITDGSEPGIITAARVRCWIAAAGAAAAVAGHANGTDAEDARATFSAIDGTGGTWTSQKLVRTL